MRFAAAFALALALLAGTAGAQPRHGQGGGQAGGHGRGGDHGQQQQGQGQGQGRGSQPGRIADTDRSLIQAYFGQQFAQGNCPPGLARKANGCQAPGQARKWAVGQPLPIGLGHSLPPDLLGRLVPPPGHTYLRVGTDILLIATGTRIVAAGLTDLLR